MNQISSLKPASKPIAPAPFEEARPQIRSGQLGEVVLRLLSRDEHSSAECTNSFSQHKPVPPPDRDGGWIEALRDELVRSMLRTNGKSQRESYFLAGTLASFGATAIPALVFALEKCLDEIPAESSGYRFKPVFHALSSLDSGAGIPAALALIERAKKMTKPVGFGSALDYIYDRPDAETLPAIEHLLTQKLFGRSRILAT